MACRIGITTDPDERKQYWQSRCRGFKNWRILERGLTKAQADAAEQRLAKQHNCEAHAGGPSIPGQSWSVYFFEHSGCST